MPTADGDGTDKMTNDEKYILGTLTERIESLHEKIDTHVKDENKTFVNIENKIDNIDYAINNVQANGRKGLNESIQDVMNKIIEVNNKLTEHISSSPINWRLGDTFKKINIRKTLFVIIATIYIWFASNPIDRINMIKHLLGII